MKKKFLAALLSLLMICTMASGVFAAYVIPGANTVVTNPDGTVKVLSNNFMYEECPECDYDEALYYVLDGDVKFYCPSCKESGFIIEGHDYCWCGRNCDCRVKCSCGKYVTCGESCNNCGKYVSCPSDCDDCWENYYDCWCGKDCDCTVKCGECGRRGTCGEYCTKCGEYLTCSKYCDDCYDRDYFDKCICGYDCDCKVQCLNCLKVGNCGSYCAYCRNYLSCPKWCSGCGYWEDEYTITVSTNVGGEYAITGGAYGSYGEVKTLTIDPDAGYAISDVVINGKSYGSEYREFEIKMVRDYYVKVTFVKLNLKQQYRITAEAEGNGKITLVKNGDSVKDTSSVKAAYGDTLVYRFIPGGDNYYIENVKVNGRSIGAKSVYTLSKVKANTSIEVVFGWKCPYTDVSDEHMDAVEYVTEAGIMSSINSYINTDLFKGTNRVSVKTFAAALAEMADTEDELDTVDERIEWAIDNGIIDEDHDLATIVNVKRACTIMAEYLEVLEDKNDITFVGDKSTYTAKETCVALKLVSEKAYTNNASISRYNLAELCYAIANLEYDD